ncbi:NAD-dependent epimerase/dehydratase family protein [Hahella ganghwensis]|uniref:NAD-dependent epimerase/dehydratase family protein n=1 Tax=Hahella ganghwensis TaxID=286420 RepID=UPI0003658312|nr:NAD-dependent epimerase/dehydratase family protein [Hahella ganghwensis]
MEGGDRSALILGATGLVGSHLLKLLLADSLYSRILTLTRRNIACNNPRLKQHVIEFKDFESTLETLSVNDIYCCLGTTIKQAGSKKAFNQVDYEYPLKAAEILKPVADHFLLVSAIGADSSSNFFYNRVKGRLEEALAALGYGNITIVRPSLLLGERNPRSDGKSSRIMESIGIQMAGLVSPMLIGPLANYAPVEAEDVARTLVRAASNALKEPEPTGVRVIESQHIGRL